MSQNRALIAISTMYQFQDLEIRHLIVILSFRFLIQDDEKVKHWDRGGVPLWQEPHCLPQQGQDRDVRVGGRIQLFDHISHEHLEGWTDFSLNLSFLNSLAGWGSRPTKPVLCCYGSYTNLRGRFHLRQDPGHSLDPWGKDRGRKESLDKRDQKENRSAKKESN